MPKTSQKTTTTKTTSGTTGSGILSRLRNRHKSTTTTTTTHLSRQPVGATNKKAGNIMRRPVGTEAPVHHHQRKTSVGDKMSGAMMKLRGSLTGRPGVKAAGTRRQHGTDGRGARTHV